MKKHISASTLPARVKYQWQTFFIRRNYRDRLFIRLFHDPAALLQLYNALNGTSYANPAELTVTTIDDVLYLGMKNDCSFIIGSWLNLYEQQSTFCPNMPIRGLLYLSALYQGYIAGHGLNLYGVKAIRLPAPKYIVFYNGAKERPEKEELLLSDSFTAPGGCLECRVLVLNINEGKNPELLQGCRTLYGYSVLVGKIREYQQTGMSLAAAADAACEYCIEHDLLKEFLEKHRNEVRKLLLTEYNAKKQRAMDRRDARAEGLETGRAEGLETGRAEGLELGSIRTTILLSLEYGESRERILTRLQKDFSLSPEQAADYYDRYAPAGKI